MIIAWMSAYLVVRSELHKIRHVDLIECGQHGIGILGTLQPLRHARPQPGHLHPPAFCRHRCLSAALDHNACMSVYLHGLLKAVGQWQTEQQACLNAMGMQPTSQAWAPLLLPAHVQQPLRQWPSDSCDPAESSSMQLHACIQLKSCVWLTKLQTLKPSDPAGRRR